MAAFVFAPPAHAATDVLVPANGAILNTPPTEYSGTGGAAALTGVNGQVLRTVPPPIVVADLIDNNTDSGFFDDTWAEAAAPLPDGWYVILVNSSFGGSDVSTFKIDTQKPDTTITGNPPDPTNSTNATFTFTASDPSPSAGLGSFECKLDTDAGFTPCSSGDSFAVTEGQRTFEVRAIDAAGNVDGAAASYTWAVDTTPPVITITTPSNGQHVLLNGTLNPVYNCTDPLAGAPPVASGVATCTAGAIDTSTLGPHLFTVNSTDNVTNASSKTVAYVVDPPGYGGLIGADTPIGYWRLGDAIGSDTMADSSGNGHHGEYKNGIALGRDGATNCERRPDPPRSCELGNPSENTAAYFPPRDGYGAVHGIAAPKTAYTMEAWVKPASAGPMMIMGHGGNAGQLFIDENQQLAFRQVQDTISSGANIPVGSWTHVAATWDGSNTRVYVNGVQVAFSNSANKTPSGEGTTFYVGYGEQAPWFHGTLDEVAYYGTALSAQKIDDRYKVGTATDQPSLGTLSGPGNTNTAKPRNIPVHPARDGLYSHQSVKNPLVQFSCSDPDGPGDIASCGMTIDGFAKTSGVSTLPVGVGVHNVTITATDNGGNTFSENYTYEVKGFSSVMGHDSPIAYFRLGDALGASVMDAQFGPDGEYKNKQDSGPTGIAGDGDKARSFEGDGGYGYVNGVAAPRYGSTMGAWIDPTDGRDQAIMGHGDAGELFIKDGTIRFRHMFTTVDSGVAPNALGFTHVVGVWDGVDAIVYLDGVEKARAQATRRPSSQSTLYVGYGELAPWFYGAIDEVVYYDKALSAGRVQQHYLADPPPTETADAPRQPDEPVTQGPDPLVTPEPTTTADEPPAADEPVTQGPDPSVTQEPQPEQQSTPTGGSIGAPQTSEPCAGASAKKRKACKKRAKALAKCKKLGTKKKRKACVAKAKKAYSSAIKRG